MGFYLGYVDQFSGGTTDIYSIFDIAISGFDADTANHKILREIVILTDGNGLDSSGYAAALASATANDVVVSVLAYDDMFYPPIVSSTHGTFGTSSALNNFIRNFCNVIDFGNDTDGDGIPNIYENSVNLYNGQTISTEYLIDDTDGDGLSDGEEVRLEIMYSSDGNCAKVVGHLISDPTSEDRDDDGIPDVSDPMPLNKYNRGIVIDSFSENTNMVSILQGCLLNLNYYDDADLYNYDNGLQNSIQNHILTKYCCASLKLFQMNYGIVPMSFTEIAKNHLNAKNVDVKKYTPIDQTTFLILINAAVNNGYRHTFVDCSLSAEDAFYKYKQAFLPDNTMKYYSNISKHPLQLSYRLQQSGVTIKNVNGIYYYDYTVPILDVLDKYTEECEEHSVINIPDYIYQDDEWYLTEVLSRYSWFASMVNHEAKFDYKRDHVWNDEFTKNYGIEYYGMQFRFYFQNIRLTAEGLGNLTYGYWGRCCDMSEDVLLAGGDYAATTGNLDFKKLLITAGLSIIQVSPIAVSTYLVLSIKTDSDTDKEHIRYGFDLYDRRIINE